MNLLSHKRRMPGSWITFKNCGARESDVSWCVSKSCCTTAAGLRSLPVQE